MTSLIKIYTENPNLYLWYVQFKLIDKMQYMHPTNLWYHEPKKTPGFNANFEPEFNV